MTLIVPKSTADPGHAARPALVEAPTTGADIARMGDVMAGVGQTIEDDRLDRQMRRLQVDMTRDLNDLTLEVSRIGDPDLADRTWQDRLSQIRAGYGQPGPDGRPRLDPANAERFGLAFEDLANRHAFALGRRTLEMRRAEREATWLAYSHEAARSGATADAGTRQELLLQGYEQIEALADAGVIDAAEAQRRKIGLEADIDAARATRLIEEDPETFLAEAEDGGFGGLSGQEVERQKARARAAIDANAAQAARATEAAWKAQEQENRKAADQIVDAAGAGRASRHEPLLQSDAFRQSEHFARAEAAVRLRDKKIRYAEMTPLQIRALLTGKDQSPVADGFDLAERQLLESVLAEHEEGYATDPIGYAQAQGLVIPDLPGFDPADPGALADGLEMRLGAAEQLVAEGYATGLQIFTDTDREALTAAARDFSDPKAVAVLAKTLAAGLGDRARGAAAELNADPVFGWAVTLAGSGAPDATLQAMLAGQGKIADKTVLTPGAQAVKTAFHEVTGGTFHQLPDLTRGVMSSALALYAEDNPGADPEDFDAEAFAPYVSRALGGDGAGRGGIQTIDPIGLRNSYELPLPPGMTGMQVERALNQVTEAMRSKRGPDGWSAPDLGPLAAISMTGAAPDFGDLSADDTPQASLSDYRLQQVWAAGRPADHYVLVRDRDGRPDYLRDTEGAVFQLRLRDLVRGAGQ